MSDAGGEHADGRSSYWDFLPRFSCLLELGNWSENWAERSLSITRAVARRYEHVLKSGNLPYSRELRAIHERWWRAGSPGETRVYRVTVQCKMPAVYKVRVSCDDDGSESVHEHFVEISHVIDNADDPGRVAESIVIGVVNMF